MSAPNYMADPITYATHEDGTIGISVCPICGRASLDQGYGAGKTVSCSGSKWDRFEHPWTLTHRFSATRIKEIV